jgi:integrase/recombinase XerD
LFAAYLRNIHDVNAIKEIKTGHVRQYIAYLQERGKYTVTNRESTKLIKFPERRIDYKKDISSITINNFIRNIKVFINWLKAELNQKEFTGLIEQFDYTKFHGYRNRAIVLFIQDTGTKIGECLALSVEAFDINNKMILITKARQVKLGKIRFINYLDFSCGKLMS